jgi:hypothetical protein
MTHDELCERAARWLRNTRRCRLVLREVVSYAGEIPDAIGWQASTGFSIMVECKTSRGDFHRDAHKWARGSPHSIGQMRFYMTPAGLLRIHELPDGWGLLEVYKRSVLVVRDVQVARELDPSGYRSELIHMLRGLRMVNGEDAYPTKRSAAYAGNDGEVEA